MEFLASKDVLRVAVDGHVQFRIHRGIDGIDGYVADEKRPAARYSI